jgi:hypothetical protein
MPLRAAVRVVPSLFSPRFVSLFLFCVFTFFSYDTVAFKQDKKYILKTATGAERDFLWEMLPYYLVVRIHTL